MDHRLFFDLAVKSDVGPESQQSIRFYSNSAIFWLVVLAGRAAASGMDNTPAVAEDMHTSVIQH
eukprot:6111502-Amphidinium_carterae.1